MNTISLGKSFVPFGVLSFICALPFYLQKRFVVSELLRQITMHMFCMLMLHLILIAGLVWLYRLIKSPKINRYFAYSYATVTYAIIFITVASAVTYYFWLVPVNSILIRDFLFHFRHYASIPFPNNSFLVIIVFIGLSCCTWILLYRSSYRFLKEIKLETLPQSTSKLIFPTLILSLLMISIGINKLPQFRLSLREVKNVFVLHNPVLYTFYIAIRRAHIRNIVAKRENELDAAIDTFTSPSKLKNIILITVDAMRADFFLNDSLRQENLPFVDSLMRNTFYISHTNAYANCNYSACGIFALLEGRASNVIEEKGLSLQHYLSRFGYKNHFILSGNHSGFGYLDIKYGTKLDFYFEGAFSRKYAPENDEVLFEGLDLLDAAKIERPYFIWFHMMGVHFVSNRSEQFRVNKPDDFDLWSKATENNTLRYVNNYRNGVLETDDRLKRLWSTFRSHNLLDQSIIVITSDHGENLGEYEQLGHGSALTPEQLHIPLVIFDEDLKHSMIEPQFTSQIDFPSLVCEQLKLPIPDIWHHGTISSSPPILSALEYETGAISKNAEGRYELKVLQKGTRGPTRYLLPEN